MAKLERTSRFCQARARRAPTTRLTASATRPARPARIVRRDRRSVPRSGVATTDLDAKRRSRRGRADARGHAPHRPGERRSRRPGGKRSARDGSRGRVRSTAKVRPIERRGRGVGERRGGAGTDAGRAGVRAAQERDGGGPLSGGSANVGRARERRAGPRTSGGRISVRQRCDGVASCDLGVAPRSRDPAFPETFADASRSSDEQCAWEGRRARATTPPGVARPADERAAVDVARTRRRT